MSNTIKIKNYLKVFEEYAAYAAITPGHLIYLKSDGTVAVHAEEDGNVLPMFAIEDELQGNGVDDAYAAGDRVQVWIPTRGDQVNAILKDEEVVAIGNNFWQLRLGVWIVNNEVQIGGVSQSQNAHDRKQDPKLAPFGIGAAG